MSDCLVLAGDCRQLLALLPPESVHCAITSPPYFGLRAYGTAPQVWGGDPACEHQFETHRYYTEQSASQGSGEAFSAAGEANQARLKQARWREDATCARCGAWRGELGLEPSPAQYVAHLVAVFQAVRRVLRSDGTLWLNLGDSYARSAAKGQHKPGDTGKNAAVYDRGAGRTSATLDLTAQGLKEKDLIGVPWRVAFALQADGWYLRSDIIWAKGNPMPESVTDRPTRSHEYLFLLTKSERYYYDHEAVREPAVSTHGSGNGYQRKEQVSRGGRGSETPWHPQSQRNRRSVWHVNTRPFKGAHFATFPPELVEPCLLAGTSEGGCCGACGAPFQRQVEKGEPNRAWQRACGGDAAGEYAGRATKDYATAGAQDASATKARILAGMVERRTVGWAPGCDCGAPATPCRVLDPFGGAGTVGLVARRHGRHALLLELNPDYAQMARVRIMEERN